ncbi:hypothetical protein DBV15_05678 [Temnothorax longispinosus]|uniref:THAP-type domain-containing protein n=1 Tax=Temnothorax longispinosus TaxID=300112 RepID=A0A4S2JSH6_9HYME|nr:hypothetical protein DBV15_05678 [Temnothorax longispinosus]
MKLTKYCVVPNCKTGCKSLKVNCSVFKVPKRDELREKWISAIPGIKDLKPNQFVREKHFDEKCIIRNFVMRDVQANVLAELPFILHHSIEAAAIILPFQDSELLVLNVYRHPNNDTPAHALNDLFNFASGYKYAFIVGDLNAHHRLWGCARNDNIGIRLASRIESYNYLILNDSTSTRFNPNTNSGSIIDLAFASSDLAGVCCSRTLDDPMASDHYPIETIINGAATKVPYTNLYHGSKTILDDNYKAYLEDAAYTKGNFHYTHYHTDNLKPWYYRLMLSRAQIVTINRLRSGHYNLNLSLFRKNIVDSPGCPCGDPYQDANHVIFRCELTQAKPPPKYLREKFPTRPMDIFPLIKNPTPKLCRLLLSYFNSCELYI